MDPWAIMACLGLVFVLCRVLLWLIPAPIPLLDVDVEDVMVRGNHPSEESYIYIPGNGKAAPDRVQCYDPATMKYLGFYPALKPDEVRKHVEQAREAQRKWAPSSFTQRRHLLQILLRYILDHQELICMVSARDSGKTMVDAALGEIVTTCEKISWLLKEGEGWLKPEYRSVSDMMFYKTGRVEYHPIGVMGAIVPWNYPFHNLFNPILSAVFSGNAIVVKVSEYASWSSCFYLRIIHSALTAADAPLDLVQVITGFGETGEALVSSVDKLIFVGSTTIGRKVMEAAAKTLTPVVLELGGKDSLIICEDVKVSQIAQTAVRACLTNSGQNCAGAERYYVHKAVHDQFVKEAAKIVKSVRVGTPFDGPCDMGAICLPEQTEKLHALVSEALDKGAEIAARGDIFLGDYGNDVVGQFFPPTILVNVNHSMAIMKEEIFGPIICVMRFSNDDEVIKLANDSNFGLGCSVFSDNKARARTIASKIYCGIAAINDFGTTYMCQSLPFGGAKNSGFGRFGGPEGLRACCLVKAVIEDRWPFIKTIVPKPLQYPVADNAFQFEEGLVKLFYGMSWSTKLWALIDVIKNLTPSPQEGPIVDSKVD